MLSALYTCLVVFLSILCTKSTPSEHDAMVVYKDALLSCEDKNALLMERLEKYERIFNVTHFNPDYDDVSIVELLFLNLREKLIKLVPNTDEVCKFDWVVGECYPKCECEFKPKLGDYSPSRACRLRDKDMAKIGNEEVNHTCDPNVKSTPWAVKVARRAQKEVAFKGAKVLQKAKQEVIVGHRIITTKLVELQHRIITQAPASDEECKWNLLQFRCSPVDMCIFDIQFGDYSLDRACRLRVDDVDNDNDNDDENRSYVDNDNNNDNNDDNNDSNDSNNNNSNNNYNNYNKDDDGDNSEKSDE